MTHRHPSSTVRARPGRPAPVRVLARALLLVPLTYTGAWAASAHYRLDPVHTQVQFAVSHAGFSQALGTVSGSTGTLEFDPHDWSTARLDVSVPLQRLDLGDADWNRAVMAHGLLDAQRWPQARFVSTRIEPLAPDHLLVHGQLSLRGVTREAAMEVRFNALKRHPLPPFRHTAGFSARLSLNRHDFGIDAWPSVIGDAVELRIEAEAIRGRAAAGSDTGPGEGEGDRGTDPTTAPADPPDAAAIAPTPAAGPQPRESTPA